MVVRYNGNCGQYIGYDGKCIVQYLCYNGNHGWYIGDGELFMYISYGRLLHQYFYVKKSMAGDIASVEWYAV